MAAGVARRTIASSSCVSSSTTLISSSSRTVAIRNYCHVLSKRLATVPLSLSINTTTTTNNNNNMLIRRCCTTRRPYCVSTLPLLLQPPVVDVHENKRSSNSSSTPIDQKLRYFSSTRQVVDDGFEPMPTTAAAEPKLKKKVKPKKSKKQQLAESIEEIYKDTYNRGKTVYLKLCYTDHDVQEGDIVKAKFYWDSIIDVTSEEFGETTVGKLEYYVNEDWVKLVPYRLYEVLQYYPCTRKQPLPLRVPSLYDEEYGTRNDMVKLKKVTPEMRKKSKEFIKMGPSAQQWLMKETIESIIKKCKVEGYTRSSNATMQHPLLSFQYHDSEGNVQKIEYSTREYVLDLAREAPWTIPTAQEEREAEDAAYAAQGKERPGSSKSNPLGIKEQQEQQQNASIHNPETVLKKLKHLLLSQPNALQHITEALHYDYVWQ